MKKIFYILACTLFAGFAAGCSGSEENGTASKLTLEVDKTSITADGADKCVFTVKMDGEAVEDAAIWQIGTPDLKLGGYEFTTATAGSYTFEARYNGATSERVTVNATEPEVPAGPEKYYRKVVVMKLTGVKCQQCPKADQSLLTLVSRIPDRVVLMSFHGYSADDPMNVDVTQTLYSRFGITGYPGAIVDLRTRPGHTGEAPYTFCKEAIEVSCNEYPATCGLRVDSKIENGKIDFTVGVTSNTGGNYRLGVFVMEDGIIYPQDMDGMTNENYRHDHTVRRMVSKTLDGDSLGKLEADKEVTRTFSVELDKDWNADNLYIVAFAQDPYGYINNVVECEANGSTDYRLNETNE